MAGAWVVALAMLALTTANPVQISAAQIQTADAVVTARRSGDLQIAVERVWSGTVRPGPVSVANLDSVDMPSGRSFIVPLSRFKTAWQVTTLPDQRKPPLIYPVTTERIEEVRRLLPRQP